MGRDSKYIGGSKVVPFRLPIVGYKAVRTRVQTLLDEIAQESQYKSQNTAKPLPASAKTTLTTKAPTTHTGPIAYVCGCTLSGGLFRRVAGCKMDRGEHIAG